MTYPCPPPVVSEDDGVRREVIRLDDCPVHGEEARAGWGEEEGL